METTRQISINGRIFHYSDTGKGEVLVFAHAGIADLRMWDSQVDELAKHYRVVAFDRPGHGLSSSSSDEHCHFQDLIDFLEALNIDRSILIGCSRGGGIAFDATLAAPEKVAGLVMVSSFANGLRIEDEVDDFPQWQDYEVAVERKDLDLANELDIQMWVDGFNQPAGRAAESVREKIREMNRLVLQNELNSPSAKDVLLEPKAANRLEQVSIPVLFIVGALDDPYTLKAVDVMLGKLPEAQRVIIPEVAHLPNMEVPGVFNKLLLEYTKRIY